MIKDVKDDHIRSRTTPYTTHMMMVMIHIHCLYFEIFMPAMNSQELVTEFRYCKMLLSAGNEVKPLILFYIEMACITFAYSTANIINNRC